MQTETVGPPSYSPSTIYSTTASTGDFVASCAETNLERPETIAFVYSLETYTNETQKIESVRKATEKALNRDMANLLLPCDVDFLQSDSALGFEGIDYVPEDSVADEGKQFGLHCTKCLVAAF